MADPTQPLRATDVVAMLRRHYLPEGRPASGIFAPEIGAPTSARRGDAIWAPFTGDGTAIVGHEVKISRSDVLTELADPMKCEAWAQFCSRWWLVVSDPSLVDGLDIPESWGIMAPPSGRRTRSMTVLRPAPLRKVHDSGPAWRRLAGWYHHHVGTEIPSLRARLEYRQKDLELAREQIRELQSVRPTATPDQVLVDKIIALVRARALTGEESVDSLVRYLSVRDLRAQDIADVFLDLERSREIARRLRHAAERHVSMLDYLIREREVAAEAIAAIGRLESEADGQPGAVTDDRR